MKKVRPREKIKIAIKTALEKCPTITPRCPHFDDCGGCEYQDYAYSDQVNAKLTAWRQLVAENTFFHAGLPNAEIIASPQEFGYRQRMDFVFAFDTAGLRRARSHRRVVALIECPLLGENGWQAFARARDLAIADNLPSYDYLKHRGFLRYFVVRQTRAGAISVTLVTKTAEFSEKIAIIATTLLAEKLATAVYWSLQESLADLSHGKILHVWGEKFIRENYLGKMLAIGANSFAQANPAVAEKAYQKIVEYLRDEPVVGDIFSGTGVIALLAAAQYRGGHFIAVENSQENIEIAQQHCREYRVDNLSLVSTDATKFLRAAAAESITNGAGDFSALTLNPPRAGIGADAAKNLLTIAPPKIIYMSCNPSSLLADLEILAAQYRVQEVTLFDMFPQTHHWETLVHLQRKTP